MDIAQIIISLFVVLFAITIHEASHGWAAYKMGDPTAHALGRITLNPIAHIDPVGTVLLPLILVIMGAPPFGWAKPVPVNPYNLKNPRRDNLLISAAGPISNFSVALIAFLAIQLLKVGNPGLTLGRGALSSLGSGLFLILYYTILINVILAVFNLIPIPPLDGSGVLMGLLPPEAAEKYEQLRPYGFIILILLIMTGIIGKILGIIMGFVNLFIF
ncbi:MAG: site-2 protease family protein [Candidatus Aminicenantes bacterium]|nr:site-2 protease family protein [Candidatus Aminicenantes bacterium]